MPRRSKVSITAEAARGARFGCLWDRDLPGFGLRVLSSGARTWVFKYRTRDGRQRWHRIGSFPALSAQDARRVAKGLRRAIETGHDPAGERAAERVAVQPEPVPTLAQLAGLYADALIGRPSMRSSGAISQKHAKTEGRATEVAISKMQIGDKSAGQVERADLKRLLHAEAARPATARILFGAFNRFMDWCLDAGHVATNPCDAIPRAGRPKPPPARRRVVALPDLARIWIAADVLPAPLGDLARLLIALPVRRGEAARLAWEDVDLSAAAWMLPGALTKNGDPHRIALHPLALRLLLARHKAMGNPTAGLAFPSPRAGNEVSAWTKMKADIAAAAGFHAWTWHDFRRSFASLMAERGVAEPVADAVLNHRQSGTRGGVLGVYQHALRWPEQKAAVEKWGADLAAAIRAAKARRNPPQGQRA